MCLFCLLVCGSLIPLLSPGLPGILVLSFLGGGLSLAWCGGRFWHVLPLFFLGWANSAWNLYLPGDSYVRLLPREECFAKIQARSGETLRVTPKQRFIKLTILRLQKNGTWHSCSGKALGVFSLEENAEYGDTLALEGAFLLLDRHGHRFNPYEIQGFSRRFAVCSNRRIAPATGWRYLYRSFLSWRQPLSRKLTEGISNPVCSGIYQAMVLGVREALDEETRQTFIRSATVHLFSISGLHVSLMAVCLGAFFRYSGSSLRYRLLSAIPFLGAYVLLCGAAPSALRAYGMVLAMMISQVRERAHSAENALGVSATTLILLNPRYLLHTGFLFSFTLVAVLLRGMELTQYCASVTCERRLWLPLSLGERFLWKQKMAFSNTFFASLAAWLGSSGLMMRMNQMISYGTIFVNLALPPFAFLLVAGAIPKLIFAFLIPPLSLWLGRLFQFLLQILLCLSRFGAQSDFYHEGQTASPGILWIFYLLLAFLFSDLKPRFLRLAALIPLLGILFSFPLRHPAPSIIAVYSGDGGPPCIAWTEKQETWILECGGKKSSRAMTEHLKQLGCANAFHLVVTSTGSVHGAHHFLATRKVASIRFSRKVMAGRKAPAFAKTCSVQGIAVAVGDGTVGTGKLHFLENGWQFQSARRNTLQMTLDRGGLCTIAHNGKPRQLMPSSREDCLSIPQMDCPSS